MSSDSLSVLHGEIERSVERIRSTHPEWPCQKGCGLCCHQLAEIPRLTRSEWLLLREGLNRLDQGFLDEVYVTVSSWSSDIKGPLTCPFLDQTSESCMVYSYRPIACRTYGFFMERGVGLFCKLIEERFVLNDTPSVVFGNQHSVELQMAQLGERKPLTEWFATIA
jgi:Fe-S-cluster containining protein